MKYFITVIIFIGSVLGVLLFLFLIGEANPGIVGMAGIIISVIIILSFVLVVRRGE